MMRVLLIIQGAGKLLSSKHSAVVVVVLGVEVCRAFLYQIL